MPSLWIYTCCCGEADWALEAIGWENVGKQNNFVQHIFQWSQYHPSTVLGTTSRPRQCSQGFGSITRSQTTYRITRSQITWISRVCKKRQERDKTKKTDFRFGALCRISFLFVMCLLVHCGLSFGSFGLSFGFCFYSSNECHISSRMLKIPAGCEQARHPFHCIWSKAVIWYIIHVRSASPRLRPRGPRGPRPAISAISEFPLVDLQPSWLWHVENHRQLRPWRRPSGMCSCIQLVPWKRHVFGEGLESWSSRRADDR